MHSATVCSPLSPAAASSRSPVRKPSCSPPHSAPVAGARQLPGGGTPLLAATLETYAGWRSGFYVVGAACVLYICFGWLRLAYSSPQECPYVSKAEVALLAAPTAPPKTPAAAGVSKAAKAAAAAGKREEASASAILLHPAILSLFSCHCVYNLTTLSINSWSPSYYAEVLHLKPDAAKLEPPPAKAAKPKPGKDGKAGKPKRPDSASKWQGNDLIVRGEDK